MGLGRKIPVLLAVCDVGVPAPRGLVDVGGISILGEERRGLSPPEL